LKCVFADVGFQIGEILRCMVTDEINTHMARIKQLRAVLNGESCSSTPTTTESAGNPASEAPPAA
jgi:hypothetical protein